MTLEQYLIEHGYSVPPYTIGKIVRFAAPNKPTSNQSAWLRVFDNGCAVFGNWITGEQHTYNPNQSLSLSRSERKHLRQEMEVERKRFEAEELAKHQRASEQAYQILEQATPASSDHPYLKRKQIDTHGVLFGSVLSYQDALIIPVYGTQKPFIGVVQTLQFILPKPVSFKAGYKPRDKDFLWGGKMKGGYYPIQWIDGAPIVICEGFATGATLAEHYAPYSSVICAFNSGNMLHVAKWLRQTYPMAQITIAGDNDHANAINAAKDKAEATAKLIRGMVAIPSFAKDEQGSDWNDRYILDQKKAQLDKANHQTLSNKLGVVYE